MPLQVVTGAILTCSFGMAPGSFVATPKMVQSNYRDCGNILDHKPMVNILPFGMCSSLANPSVASATSSAMGVLTPMPCVPVTPFPWTTGSVTVPTATPPALNDTATCQCIWGGLITVAFVGQTTETIP